MSEWGSNTAFGGDADGNGHLRGFNNNASNLTNGNGDASVPADAPGNSAFEAQVKDAGWREKVPIDYDILKASGGDYADWHANAGVYEWSDDYGEVGPEIPELEAQLFGGEFRMRQGEHIKELNFNVSVEGAHQYKPARSFKDAGLHPVILDNVVEKMHYDEPTPIQAYTIPAILNDHDVLAIAQTGSGKTAAYLMPVLSKLCGKAKKLAGPRANIFQRGYDPRLHRVTAEPLVVVVVPTRELAMQVFDEARRLCYRTMLRPVVVYGGLPSGICRDELGKGCDILIGTPGRLCDIMDKPETLSMKRVKYTIIDEADELLHDDWTTELNKIMAGGDNAIEADHHYLMFSATFPRDIRGIAKEYMDSDYYRLRVGRTGSTHKNVKQEFVFVERNQKQEAIFDLLVTREPCRTLIFCNSKIVVDLLDDFLYNRGLPTTSIHSDRPQREREDSVRSFRSGRCPILVATGVSARGLDIAGIAHVINFDLPSLMHGGIDEYIHRIGRTARIGNRGLATSFYNDRDEDMAQHLVNLLVEVHGEVPDFLSHLVPHDISKIDFDDDSDSGEADENDAGAPAIIPGIIPAPAALAATGFVADTGFTPDPVSAGGWN